MALIILIIAFFILISIGVPIAFAIGMSSLITIVSTSNLSLLILPQKMFAGIDSFALMAIPFFMFAGQVMERGGISMRLVRFASALVGHIRGGLAMSSVVSSMFFAGISGSAAADASAVGSIMVPAMIKKGYKAEFVAALQASAGSIGPIIPPSIPMIVYGSIGGVSIGALFLGGIIPGVLIGIGLMIVAYIFACKNKYEGEGAFSISILLKEFKEAFWALLAPVIIIGGIMSGVFTATEAGIIAALYCLFISMFVYKEMKIKDIGPALFNSAVVSSMVMIVISCSSLFAYLLAREKASLIAIEFLTSFSSNPTVIMLIIAVFLLIIGFFVETLSALTILAPVLAPIAAAYHLDPIHFGMIVIVSIAIGVITPPVGVVLYVTCGLAKTNIVDTTKYIWPFIAIMLLVILLLILFPTLTLVIPNLLM